jgi:hypothetical protein
VDVLEEVDGVMEPREGVVYKGVLLRQNE